MTDSPSPDPASEAAGVFRRIFALVYDIFLIGAIWFGVAGLTVILNGGEAMSVEANQFILLPLLFGATFFFYHWFWTHGGQTLGMRAWRIKIVNAEIGSITIEQSFKRFASGLLFSGLSFLHAVFRKDGKSLHDLLSATHIVVLPKE